MRNTMSRSKNNIWTALDVGATKVSCMIAKSDSKSGALHVLGVGQHASKGIKNNTITDMESLENAILNAVHAAEKMAGITIGDVLVNVTGNHLMSEIINIRLKLPQRSISAEDLNYMLAQATQVDQRKDFEIIHAIPLHYTIDGRKGIQDPIGMMGENIQCALHVITGDKGSVHSLVNCIHRCHLGVQAMVSSSIASGYATLGEDEAELGVTVIDIGGGSTDIAMFLDSQVVHIDSIPLGGYHVSNDIAHGLSVSLAQAERVKTLYGGAIQMLEDNKVTFFVCPVGAEGAAQEIPVKKKMLTSIIQPRVEEIFEMIRDRLEQTNMHIMASKRVVLTGGGSQLPGMKELAAKVLGKKVRLGKPMKIHGLSDSTLNPSFSTCAGLLTFAMKDMYQHQQEEMTDASLLESVKVWVKNIF